MITAAEITAPQGSVLCFTQLLLRDKRDHFVRSNFYFLLSLAREVASPTSPGSVSEFQI